MSVKRRPWIRPASKRVSLTDAEMEELSDEFEFKEGSCDRCGAYGLIMLWKGSPTSVWLCADCISYFMEVWLPNHERSQ
jgi:hypothetical protein